MANPRDFGWDEVEEEEETTEQAIAPPAPAFLSRYHQEQELSAMVAALSRVVAGEPAHPLMSSVSSQWPSYLSALPSSSSSGQKRGRDMEVLQYYQDAAEFGRYTAHHAAAGEASTAIVSGE